MHTATTSGNQPPVSIFTRLAPRNARSTVRNRAPTATTRPAGQRQRSLATEQNSSVVMVMVPVTAIPYADARLPDDWNVRTRSTQATPSTRFTPGR